MLRLLVTFILLKSTLSQNNPTVLTPSITFKGSILTTRLNKTIYAFRGIRYAKAPRFEAPSPVTDWPEVYDATEDGPVCPQPTTDPVSKDCLLLNVYTTKLPDNGTNSQRPVIVHLHAGGFYSATGRNNWGGPQYFLDQDIVLITLNYRLGTLGFISIGEYAPGNNGLKDQVIAMKWVQNNIEYFGGDPSSVTLYGYSAGAWSITLHLVSPMSRGLFQKVIIGSGSALGHWPLPKNQTKLANRQARIMSCPEIELVGEETFLNCLKTIPAEVLGNSLLEFAEFGQDPVLIWSPVIEEDYGHERFLEDYPIQLIQNGSFANIPVVIGVTRDEFLNRAFPLVANSTLLEELDKSFETYAPICFIYEKGTNKSTEVSLEARQFYFGNKTITDKTLPELAKIYADSIVGFPVHRTANLLAEKNTQPVYFYEFAYQGRYSHFYLPDSDRMEPYGVVHHDDLIYLFYISVLFPYFDDTYPESEMVQKLSTLWANFAQTGNPTPNSNILLDNVKWEIYNTSTTTYLEIGDKLELKERLNEDRYSFWDTLFPIKNNI